MKQFFPLIAALAVITPLCEEDSTARLKETAEVTALLNALPPQRVIWQDIWLLRQQPPSADVAAVASANRTMKTVRELIPKLKKLLKPGVSIFEYPSLLAHGDITYTVIKYAEGAENPFASTSSRSAESKPAEYGYRLYLGIPKSEFMHPFDFEILFDSTGIIRAINSVDWKK